jgi:creatinine amidohydrolase/Fe(II)-dependent formamide hydrolase-like protein
MEQVLFESAAMLIKYGFRRFMFFNYHGGNNIVQQKVIHRINHTTEAIAIAIGIGGSVQKSDDDGEFFDWHAGKSETSIMLYLKPEFVTMERAEKPEIHLTQQVQELYELSKQHPELSEVAGSMLGVPESTKKGGASHELSSNGVWSFSDPKSATKAMGQQKVEKMVETAVKFIEAWQLAKQ